MKEHLQMKTLAWVKTHLNELDNTFFDSRFTSRFMDFLPAKDWPKYGFKPMEGEPAPKRKAWTEKNVLAQLKEDVAFGIEKATDHRGISAGLMFEVVRAWCIVLENGLENTPYGYYGDKFFKAVDKKYKFGLVGKDTFNEQFYKEW